MTFSKIEGVFVQFAICEKNPYLEHFGNPRNPHSIAIATIPAFAVALIDPITRGLKLEDLNARGLVQLGPEHR